MAFVDFIPEHGGGGFSRFPHRAPELVPPRSMSIPQPSAPLPSAIAPPQTAMYFRPPAFCPRCYSQFNASFALSGLCPHCSCSLPQLRPPPPSVPRPITAPIMHLTPLQPHKETTRPTLASREDRFQMTDMLHVIDDVLKEQDERSEASLPLTSGSSPINLSPAQVPPIGVPTTPFMNDMRVVHTNGDIVPTVGPSEITRGIPQPIAYGRLCQCGNKQIVFCADCRDYLCGNCLSCHETDHHLINSQMKVSVPTSLGIAPPITTSCAFIVPPPSTNTVPVIDPNNLDHCQQHTNEKNSFFCSTCVELICQSCALSEHSHHTYMTLIKAYMRYKPSVEQLLSKSQVEINLLDLSINGAEKMSGNVAVKQGEAIEKVKEIFQAHREVLAQREQEVISQINSIADLRIASLANEMLSIEDHLTLLKALTSQAEKALQDSNQGEILVAHVKLSDNLQKYRSHAVSRNPSEDDSFILKSNTTVAEGALKSLCMFTTAPYPPMCTVMGEGLYHPRVNRLCTVILCTKDRSGENCLEGGERLFVQLKSTPNNGSTLSVDIRDNTDGSYSINFRPRVKGEHQLVIAIRGQHIQGSPFTLLVDGGREYGRFGVVTLVFGSEGSGNAQFCRPWGICCDHHGNLIIGDRSNHRVQVFDSNGIFKYHFGTEGVQQGQFNRPAGVAVTREGNVVVADKDNHRIQVLKPDGSFLFMFGSKGGNDGQMIYPYDVAVNQLDGRIAVTDTGNHRLLIFSHDGILLGKFGYKGYLCGHFDSPRGIAFNDDGHIIISDFNVHHILVIHPDGTTARILGSQGSGNGQFMRPQGIAVDHMGNYIIADTRNNRVVIMHPSGHFIAKFGLAGQAPGQFDRPTSIAVMPDGRIAVVDFGNSRIQIF